MSARAERERDYWNKMRAGDNAARSEIAKYYSIAGPRFAAYTAALERHGRGGARMLEADAQTEGPASRSRVGAPRSLEWISQMLQ